MFRNFKWRLVSFSTQDDSGIGQDFIYCPHPFTNWSLNPGYRNLSGQKLHTIEGFRKTSEYESVENFFIKNEQAKKIYCLGGSTTYCTGVTALDSPWPSRLGYKIARYSPETECVVANAGVGAWNTLQSFIRLISWAPILKPDLIIVYQAKNDLTPLYHADFAEKRVLPDYSNLMGQFSQPISQKLFFRSRICKQSNGGISIVYGDLFSSPEGLSRFDGRMLMASAFRYEMIYALSEAIGARVLFMPEIIWGSPYYTHLRKLDEKLLDVVRRYKRASFYDMRPFIPNEPRYFLDKAHLTEEGCDLFADILARHIAAEDLLM